VSKNSVHTFGCRLNTYESEIINGFVKKHDLQDKVIVVNSCAVTNGTESGIIRFVKKYKKDNPEVKIIFTGCGAQTNPEKYNAISEIDYLIGNKEKMEEQVFEKLSQSINNNEAFVAENIAKTDDNNRHQDILYKKQVGATSINLENRAIVNNIMSVKDTASHLVEYFEGQTRAFVQIQNGCNHRCTFCIIPYGRGNSRSTPLGDIVAQINKLTENGYKEVVLTGVDITDYGKDLPSKITLSQAIKRILQNCPALPRLRLSSIDVAETDEELFEILASEPRFMPYFHISLQSGDDLVLKQMARRHKRDDVINFCNKVKQIKPDAMFGADIISAFPTETEAAFQNSLDIIEQADISFGHIFTFSPKNGTPAAKMKQLNGKIAKERTKLLIEKSKAQLLQNYSKMIGGVYQVLTEQNNLAHTQNFALVKINGAPLPPNQFVNVKITSLQPSFLVGEVE